MHHPYKIREATKHDKKSVINLFNEVFSKQQRFNFQMDEKFWHWKYESSVYGKSIIHVIEHNNEIIGSGALWPWKFITRGELFHVYQSCDTVIHPAHQGKGLFSLFILNRIHLLKKKKSPFGYSFPNQNSLPGYLKFGWQYMVKLPWMLKILHPIRICLSLKDNKKSNPLPINTEDRVDLNSNSFTSDESVYFNKYLSTYREDGFFEWRYKQNPFFHYGQVLVELGRNKAGAIFSINQKGNNREMIVVDIFGVPKLTSMLFNQIQLIAKKYDVDFIVTLFNKFYQMDALWKKGYIKVRNKNMVLLPFDIRIEDRFTRYENWNPIAAMHDSI